MRRLATLVAIVCVSTGLFNCADHGPTEVAGGATGTSLSLSPMILVAGETTSVAALLPDAEDAADGVTRFQWRTSDPTVVALVNDTLLVTGAEGSAEISVASSLSRNTTQLQVLRDYGGWVASISVALRTSSLQVGDTTRAEAILRDARGNRLIGYAVIWYSSNPAVATVTQSGRVRARAVGDARIIAWRRGESGYAVLTVGASTSPAPPAAVASVSVSLVNAAVIVGDSTAAAATVRDAAGNVLTGRAVIWTSDNAPVATITTNGTVRAVSAGSAQLIATSESVSGRATIVVSTATPTPVASVSVALNSSTLAPGQATQATASTFDANGSVLAGRAVTWSSDNTAIATVSASGLVTAVAAGPATMTATSEGKSGSASLTVVAPPPAPVASVEVALNAPKLSVGQSTQAVAMPRDANGQALTDRTVTWSSDNTAIATTTPAGVVTAVSIGTASIVATSEGKSGQAAVSVVAPDPIPVASVSVALSAGTLTPAKTTQATATMRDSSGAVLTQRPNVWSSSNTAAATVSASGLVTAVAAGTANIIATSEGKSGSALLTVTPPALAPVASVSVSLNASTLSVGQTTQASAVARDSASVVLTGRPVTWTSSNAAVTTVSASGVVTAVGAGSAGVTATIEGIAGSTTLQVATVATTLAVVKQPAGAVSGVPLTTQPVVQVRDAAGTLVSGVTTPVTASLIAGAGKLVGTTTVAAVNGVATFTNLRIDGVGAHTLAFSATGLAGASAASLVVTQTPAALAIQTQPAGATTGSALATQPVVRILDNAGLLIASSALVVSSNVVSGTATLTGSSATAVSGVAAFTNLRLDGAGNVTLRFQTATPALAIVSASVPVAVGVPATLTLTLQPGSATTSGVALAPQPVVQLRDVANNAVPAAGVAVTAAIASGGGTLGGTATVTTNASGVATFTNLAITGADGARTLAFVAPSASPAITGVTSATVSVITPAVVGAACTNQPPGYTTIQDQPWDVTPSWSAKRTSLGWVDGDGDATTKLSVVSDPTSPYSWANHNVVAGLFRQGDPGGSAPFRVYRPFGAGEQYKSLYICLYLKHSAGFENTNGNTGTKFLWPAGDQVEGTQTYNGHDGSNMDFQFFQQGAVDRRLGANLNAAAAQMLGKRGQWVKYEMLLRASASNSTPNGELHVWIDGVKTHQYTDVQWQMGSARTWQSLAWNPTYGGGFNNVPKDEYQYIDHIHISGAP